MGWRKSALLCVNKDPQGSTLFRNLSLVGMLTTTFVLRLRKISNKLSNPVHSPLSFDKINPLPKMEKGNSRSS